MNKAVTRAEHIDPALKAAGWGVVEESQIRCDYPINLQATRREDAAAGDVIGGLRANLRF